ncbi:MAG: hypothetical protein WCI18_00110 [Pseudomonadota bacterium]
MGNFLYRNELKGISFVNELSELKATSHDFCSKVHSFNISAAIVMGTAYHVRMEAFPEGSQYLSKPT